MAVTARSTIIPPARDVVWEGNVGIPGGIPAYAIDKTATSAPYNADSTGSLDATAAINAAISACSLDKAVYLPAGTYKVLGAINLKRHCVLRGAGTNTVLRLGDNGQIRMETTVTDSTSVNIASGFSKGSTTLTLSSSSGVAVGEPVLIDELNDPQLVNRDGTQGGSYLSRNTGTRVLQFIHQVVGKSGNTITISPAMPFTLSPGLTPQMYRFVNPAGLMEWSGVEDLKLINVGESGVTDGYAIEIRGTAFCWVKGVEIQDLCEAGIYLLRAFRNEVRGCYIHHGALNEFDSGRAYGVNLWWGSSYNLIEDNICYYLRHSFVIEGGGAGNVFAYNYSDRMFDQFYPNTDYLMGDLLLHGSHPIMNLYEGNVARILYFDNVHGSGSHNTAFRNWLVGESQGANVPWMDWSLTPVGIDQNHLSNNIIANVLGKAAHGPGIYESKSIGVNSTHYVYILGQSDRANLGTAPGWDQVRGTLLRHLNWDFNTSTNNGVRYDDTGTTSDLTLPASLYRSTKPPYFGNLPWPPFDPRNPSLASVASIPAGYRYLNGRYPTVSMNPVIAISPGSHDYGLVTIRSTNDFTFRVENVGGGTLAGLASAVNPFSILGSGNYSLSAGSATTVTVRYVPNRVGTESQVMSFSGAGGATASVQGTAASAVLSFDASSGVISLPFVANSDQSVSQTVETTNPSEAGLARYPFNVTSAGTYMVEIDVLAPSEDANSLFLSLDLEPTSPTNIWDIPATSEFQTQAVNWRGAVTAPQTWTLSTGTHSLLIRGREANVKFKRITILSLDAAPAPPTGLTVQAQ